MKIVAEPLPGLLVLEPRVFGDARGFFFESYNRRVLASVGVHEDFVQDNHSRSAENVLRGLHYQSKHSQGKLVRVVRGEVLDVAVDVRRGSATFGKSAVVVLTAEAHTMIYVPVGFAHGFLVRSASADVLYKTTDYWAPEYERSIAWNDPDLAIDWGLDAPPILSPKDAAGLRFREAEPLE
jgi:dTDP-4-dehydrorhamnose 3,5-epimerase